MRTPLFVLAAVFCIAALAATAVYAAPMAVPYDAHALAQSGTPTPDQILTLIEQIRATSPILTDDFRRDRGLWPMESDENATFAYVDRAFEIEVLKENWLASSVTKQEVSDFYAEVDAALVDGPSASEFGLAFRYNDAENFYLYAVTGEGSYSLWKLVANEWEAVVDWTETEALLTDAEAVNRLAVLAQGPTITLLANDTVLTQAEDDTFSAGRIALAVGTFDEAGAVVAFDNFDLWEIQTLPTPTPTAARPTATPTPDPIAKLLADIREADPDFTDDFRRNDGTWGVDSDETSSIFYQRGAYHISVAVTNTVSWGTADLDVSDFLVEVDAKHVAGPLDNEMGVIFRQQDNDNFYVFMISSDGYYRLEKLVDGEWEQIIKWTESSAVNTGEGSLNRFGVLAQGTKFRLFVNDVLIDEAEDDTFDSGNIGLAVGSFGEAGIEIAFDNIDLWELEPAPAPTPTPTPRATLRATATPTPRPTPTPTPRAFDPDEILGIIDDIRSAETIFSDDFRQSSGRWSLKSDENASFKIASRALVIEVMKDNWLGWSTLDETVGDFYVEVDATLIQGPEDSEYGVIFRYLDADNFYAYAVASGSYSLWKLVDDEWYAIVDWTESDAIATQTEEFNRLAVLAQGTTITLLANDVVLTQVEDNTFDSGQIALGVGTFDEGGATVLFDNFDLWDAAALPSDLIDQTSLISRLAEIRAEDPTFSDDFRRDRGVWDTDSDEDVTRKIAAGTYQLLVATPDVLAWSNTDVEFADFLLDIDTTHLGGPLDNEFGVIFRYVDEDNYYLFSISSDGYYRLQKQVDDEWETILGWYSSEAIETGERSKNHITILAEGPQFIFLVNDVLLEQVEDDTFDAGSLGLAAGTFDEGDVEIAFDNLQVWELKP